MIKGTISGVLGMILLNLSILSALVQGVAVLVQSIRYNTFVFFGGWDWLQWTIIALAVSIILIIGALVSVARD